MVVTEEVLGKSLKVLKKFKNPNVLNEALSTAITASDQKEIDRLLMMAIHHGNIPAVEKALANGANPNKKVVSRDGTGVPLIFIAFSRLIRTGTFKKETDEDAKIFELLLQHGADINVRVKRITLLDKLIQERDLDGIAYLIDQGASINSPNSWNFRPLETAILRDNEPLARLLLEKGAAVDFVNKRGETALSQAISHGNKPITRLLLQHEASVDSMNKQGETPLYQALLYGKKGIAKLLIQYHAPINTIDKSGDTLLHNAISHGKISMGRLLIENGAWVDAPNKHGRTPLHYAAVKKRPALLRLLLNKGASVNSRNDLGYTPLHEAAAEGKTMNAQALLEHGAYVNIFNELGETPLLLAVQNRKKELVELLIKDYGADIHAKQKHTFSALINATPLNKAETPEDQKQMEQWAKEWKQNHKKDPQQEMQWFKKKPVEPFLVTASKEKIEAAEKENAPEKKSFLHRFKRNSEKYSRRSSLILEPKAEASSQEKTSENKRRHQKHKS